jgi:hypothetical protein
MQKQPPSSFCAVAAIAAALALGSTAGQAQDTGPAPDVPTIVAPAPTPVTPAPAPAAAQISAPVVQAVPAATAPEPTAERAAPRSQPTAARSPAARVAHSAPVAAAAVAAAPAAVARIPAAAPPAVDTRAAAATASAVPAAPVPSAAPPVARAQPGTEGVGGAEAGLIALLAAGGLAGAGLIVARSRRKRGDDEVFEAPAERGTTPANVPVATSGAVAATRSEPAAERFVVPAGTVPSGTDREALLQRMVAAPPDEANPFTSPRSRRKRARLILQHREHLQQTQGAGSFDWRTYRSSKPAVADQETEPSPA